MDRHFGFLDAIRLSYKPHCSNWFQKHLNFTLGIAIWFALWLLRSGSDPTRRQDLYILILIVAWSQWENLTWLFTPLKQLPISALLSSAGCIISLQLLIRFLSRPSDSSKGKAPWLLPSTTSHTRFFPQKHSFSYSLLQVAVSVGSEGRFSSLVSVGDVKRKGWFHVQASDYLERNSKDDSLDSKLRIYLRSQGIEDKQWDHAYLVTAPRFLGYSFNPVSFWYIYTSQDVLTIMILEVNNTFGERRIYLLCAKSSDEKSEDSYSNLSTLAEELKDLPNALPTKFRNAWTKDFHVSPFSSRKGYYMLTAADPFQGRIDEPPVFSNTITLKSSKDHIKLVARVYLDGVPVNSSTSSWQEMCKFVLSWSWVGFLTFPRILKEAAVLFWVKKLHVWSRPEVMPTTIGRSEEIIETQLALFFEAYLESLITACTRPVRVLYVSNLSGSAPCIYSNVMSNIDNDNSKAADNLEIRVLSPVFFTRFVHYVHTSEAFDRECTFTDEKNRTIWVSSPDLLSQAIGVTTTQTKIKTTRGFVDQLRWYVHNLLRCPPAKPAYPFWTGTVSIQDIRQLSLSPLDRFVMTNHTGDAWRYRRLCARLFLAQRFAFGFVQIIDFIDFAVRVGLVATGILTLDDARWNFGTVAWAISWHLWALAKGV